MDEVTAAIALQLISGLGRITHVRLLRKFGSASDVWVYRSELKGLSWLSARVRSAIESGADMGAVERALSVMEGISGWVMVYGDADYPVRLADIYDPPPVIYGVGQRGALSMDSVALVGSRKATGYGRQAAAKIAEGLVQAGVAVVSGLAIGIDTAAHRAAVSAGGVTVAVKGCGLDVPYPRSNLKLVDTIVEQGAVISEFPPATGPEPRNFPVRNRIISGIALGVVVVEAAEKSGSLITASMAGEQGRDVMAVPGNIFSGQSRGTHWLMREGGAPVTSAADVLEVIGRQEPVQCRAGSLDVKRTPFLSGLSADEQRVYDALSDYPVHIDDLADVCDMTISKISAVLVKLELEDIVKVMPGQMYCRMAF